ncbi:unnamed protein product [Rhizoctonia solani]|uniref:Uncharacterized protein n=1 Tax=Rhizoctonia solani TaxID=456999 RepID=A0A8H2XXD5_9AGAM|nr:unnamed protein product [Rhizoctonia solani]
MVGSSGFSEPKLTPIQKFCADPEKEECYILVTDTVKVWAEGKCATVHVLLLTRNTAVQGRHISHRSPPPLYPRTEKQQRRFVREMLQLIHAAHQLCRIADMEIVAEQGGSCADLSLTITTPTLNWEWRTFALRPSHAACVLSELLILPMLTQMSIMSVFGAGFDLEAFTKQLDKTSKTARITKHTHLRAVFSKPVVACGLVRIMQIWEQVGEEFLYPVVEDLEELEPITAPLYFPEPISDDEPEPEPEPHYGSGSIRSSPAPLITAPLYFPEPISDDEPEPEPEPHYGSNSIRSSPAPLPDADGSATEDEDEGAGMGVGETQVQTQVEGSTVGTGSSRSQATTHGSQFQAPRGLQPQPSKYGGSKSQSQSQPRPPIHPARSHPHPSRSSAQLSIMGPGGRSISQPQIAGQKRRNGGSDSDSDEYERTEELLRRRHGATTSGAIGMKKTVGRRKF